MRWAEAAAHSDRAGEAYVIATVLATTGSSPRPAGSKMVITTQQTHDTIGGGQFEWLVIERARQVLTERGAATSVHHFPLAAAANQCCGGSVTVLLEHMPAPLARVAVFGGGNVGRRVVGLLSELPVHVRWLDTRHGIEPEGHVACEHFASAPDIAAEIAAEIRPQARALVMTHDHLIDFELVLHLLQAGCSEVGLIGSSTKAARFSARLRQHGATEEMLSALKIPIGDARIQRKEPMAIAISVVAELLAGLEEHACKPAHNELTWRQIRHTLVRDDGG